MLLDGCQILPLLGKDSWLFERTRLDCEGLTQAEKYDIGLLVFVILARSIEFRFGVCGPFGQKGHNANEMIKMLSQNE
jgi:hypothetical protein